MPLVVYGGFAAATGLKTPGDSPMLFLTGAAVAKLGTAFAFMAPFYLARDVFGRQWLLYAGIWWLMFAIGEAGQLIGSRSSWQEATAGVIPEAIYFPVSGLIVNWLAR